jgi:hypothetical protein
VAGLILVASGWQVTAFARDTGLAACVAAGGDCQVLVEAFTSRYGSLLEPVSLFGALLPVALGLLFGGPLLARELEQDTHRLAWTQSVTRSRWLAARLALAGGVLIAVAAVAAWLLTWWWERFDQLQISSRAVLERGSLVPVATAVLAFTVATAAGALTRRSCAPWPPAWSPPWSWPLPSTWPPRPGSPHGRSPSPTRPASPAPAPP